MKLIFPLLIVSMLLLGCKEKTPTYTDATVFDRSSFQTTKKLPATPVQMSPFLNPTNICLIDTGLVSTNRGSNHLMTLHSLHSGHIVGEFLNNGRGPNEMMNTRYVSRAGKSEFCVHDMMINKLLVYKNRNLGNPDSIQPIRNITLSKSAENAKWSTSGRVYATPGMGVGTLPRLVVFNVQGDSIGQIGEFSKYGIPVDNILLPRVFDAAIVLSEDESRIAVVHKITDLIEIYDTTGNLIARKHGPDHFFPEYSVIDRNGMMGAGLIDGKTRNAYFTPVAADNSLWVIYNNGTDIANIAPKSSIYRFDWSGAPLAAYDFDCNLRSFDIDTETHTIYGLTDVDGEAKIVSAIY